MKNQKLLIIAISLVIASFFCLTVQAQQIVELKSVEDKQTFEHKQLLLKYENSLSVENRQEFRVDRKKRKEQNIEKLNKAMSQALQELQLKRVIMAKNKFVVVSEEAIDSKKWYFDNEDAFTNNLTEFAPVGFHHINFNKTPLKHSEYIGALAFPEEDGYIHDIVHMINHKQYGRILIQEFSFGSSVETKSYSISKPNNNIYIKGHPAEYTVVKSVKTGRGVTTLHFYSSSVDYYVTIYSALTSKKDLKFLRELGESLI